MLVWLLIIPDVLNSICVIILAYVVLRLLKLLRELSEDEEQSKS